VRVVRRVAAVAVVVVGFVAGATVGVVPASAAVGAGAVAPGAPTGVVASPVAAGVAVSWVAPSSDGGSPVMSYEVSPSVGDPVVVG